MNYQVMKMEFRDTGGQRVVLRGMSTGVPKIMSNKCIEAIFRHGDCGLCNKVFDHHTEAIT
jgi:hypothetical protein